MVIHPALQWAMAQTRVDDALVRSDADRSGWNGFTADSAARPTQPPGREGSPGRGWTGRINGGSGAWLKLKSAARFPS